MYAVYLCHWCMAGCKHCTLTQNPKYPFCWSVYHLSSLDRPTGSPLSTIARFRTRYLKSSGLQKKLDSLSLVEETFISCSLQVVLLKVYVCGLLVPLLYGRRQTVYPEVQTCQKCSPIASKKRSLPLSETVVSAYFFKSFPLLLSFSIYFSSFYDLRKQ